MESALPTVVHRTTRSRNCVSRLLSSVWYQAVREGIKAGAASTDRRVSSFCSHAQVRPTFSMRDDYVGQYSLVRVTDAYVDRQNIDDLGLNGTIPHSPDARPTILACCLAPTSTGISTEYAPAHTLSANTFAMSK